MNKAAKLDYFSGFNIVFENIILEYHFFCDANYSSVLACTGDKYKIWIYPVLKIKN